MDNTQNNSHSDVFISGITFIIRMDQISSLDHYGYHARTTYQSSRGLVDRVFLQEVRVVVDLLPHLATISNCFECITTEYQVLQYPNHQQALHSPRAAGR